MHNINSDSITRKAHLWQTINSSAIDLLSFEQLKEIYHSIFSDEPLGIAWQPDEFTLINANIYSIMLQLELEDYHSLYEWSIKHKDLYWQMAVETLGISFNQKYHKLFDNTVGGNENPVWFAGAHLNIIESCFQANADKIAITSADEDGHEKKLTYQELQNLSNQVSNGLLAQGFQAGDRIVLYIPLCTEAVAAYLGIIQAGMLAVLVADSFSPHELSRRLESSQAKAVVAHAYYTYSGKKLAIYDKIKEADAPQAIIIGHHQETELRTKDIHWDDFLGDNIFSAESRTPESIISILFSSGTTSEPKAIPWTQLTPIKCAADAYFHQDIHTSDTLCWTTGMGWMMGPWTIFAALINKATLALFTGSAASTAFGSFIEKAEVSILGTIPSLVKVWRKTKMMEAFDWKVRVFSSTGEPSQQDDYLYLMWLAKFKAPIIEYCGGTEIGGAYISGTVVQAASPATFTTPALGMELRFRNEETGEMSQDQDGEVYIVPPSIGLSQKLLNRDHHAEYYEGNPQLEDGTRLRKHGDSHQLFKYVIKGTTFYKSKGRADDSMNLGGIKISAVEIEKIINQHPSIFESAAVSITPQDGGPEALLIYYIPQEQQVDAEKLKKECQSMISDEINPLFRIKGIIARADLPRTASNKLMRRMLRKEYMEMR